MLADLSAFINQALRSDAQARRRLQAMGERTLRLELPPLPAFGVRIAGGRLDLGAAAAAADLAVHGHLAAFVRYVISGRADGIRLDGDGETAQDLRDFLSALDLDWEELLSRAVGDVPARLAMRTLAEVAQAARRFGAAAESNARDYLREECELLPHALEMERFVREVDRLRDDLARFETRLGRLGP